MSDKLATLLFGAFLLTSLACSSAMAQDRGVKLDKSKPAAGERRVALVIGNSRYHTSPLKNPVNDARAMGSALRHLGFEVQEHTDLDQSAMKRAIIKFGQELKRGGVGLFYYAGHGMQFNGRNFLIPIDAKLESEEHVESDAVDVSMVLSRMDSAKNRLNIVILDACRNNPFARSFRSASRGLASMDAPSGTLISYATSPGKVAADGTGNNGTFTEALVAHMGTPGIPVEKMFKRVRAQVKSATRDQQTPWEVSSLVGDFYFVAGSAKASSSGGAVFCPPGTVKKGNACVANVDCPSGTQFVQGRGCVPLVKPKNTLRCPAGTKVKTETLSSGGTAQTCVDNKGVGNGPRVVYYDNGNKWEEGTVRGGVYDGRVMRYRTDGNFDSAICYSRGSVRWSSSNKAKAKYKRCP